MPRLSDIEVALTAQDKTGSALASAKRNLEKFGEAASTVAAAAAVVGGALVAATKTAIDYASSIVDAAEQTGLGVESFQALRFAAGQAGVSAEEFTSAMSRFNTTIGAAANGSRAQADLFARMGVAIRDAGGNVRSSEAVLADFANAIQRIDNPAQQARAAAEAFGRSAGPKMAVLLREGEQGMESLMETARRSGAVLSEDVARRAEAAGDDLARLDTIIRTQVTDALVTLTPAISAVGQAFADAAPYVAKFYEQLSQVEISRATASIDTYGDRVQALRAKLRGEDTIGSILGAPAPGSVAERTIKEDLAREEAGLEAARSRLRRLQREQAAVANPPARAPAAGAVGQTSAEVAAAKAAARERADAEKAALRDVSDFAGAEQIRQQIATEDYYANLAQQRDEFVRDSEAALPGLMEDVFASVSESSGQTVATALEAFESIQDKAAAAADRTLEAFDSILFAGFTEGTDGMLDAFRGVVAEMVLELAKARLKEALTSVFGSILGAVGGTTTGGELSKSTSSAGTGALKGFASGGSFTVPGPSTGDRVVPIFRANGGEVVTVTPKGQGGQSGSGVTIVQHINAPGATAETVAMIRAESAKAARTAVGEVINMRQRGRL